MPVIFPWRGAANWLLGTIKVSRWCRCKFMQMGAGVHAIGFPLAKKKKQQMLDDDDRPLKEIKIQGIKFHFVGLSAGEKMGRPLSMRLFDIIFFSEIHCLTHRAISTFLFLFPRVYTISFTHRRLEEMKQTYRQPSQVTPSFWYFGRFRKCLTGQRLFQSSWTQKIF